MESLNNKNKKEIKPFFKKWSNLYFENTKDKEIGYFLQKSLEFVKEKNIALDLAAGALADSKFLLKEGFKKVVAVDPDDISKYDFIEFPNEGLEYIVSTAQEFNFPLNKYNLVVSNNFLSFLEKDQLVNILENIFKSLKDDGIFTGNFFDKSSENFKDNLVFVEDKDEVLNLLKKFQIIKMDKEEALSSVNNRKLISYKFICRKI